MKHRVESRIPYAPSPNSYLLSPISQFDKLHCNDRPFPQFALHMDPAALGFNDLFALIETKTGPVFLGGAEGSEQGIAHELRAHAAARVAYREFDGGIALRGGHLDPPGRTRRIQGVHHEVSDDTDGLGAVERQFR